MRTGRWELAANPSVSGPAPVLMYPTAYDIKLQIDRSKNFPVISIGPVRTKKPSSLVPYDSYYIKWTPQVFSIVDNTATITKYQAVSKGPRRITIDWKRAGQTLATTFYDIVI
jgi:hypothetical protein